LIILSEYYHIWTPQESNSEQTLDLENVVDKEDRPKLENLLEDMVILLKDDPNNKSKIKQMWNKIMNGYGHAKIPIFEILESVKIFSIGNDHRYSCCPLPSIV
jgi:hypothetical protein